MAEKFLCRRIVRPHTHFVVGGLQRRRHTETYLSHARMVVSHYLEKRFKRGTREVDFLGVMCFAAASAFASRGFVLQPRCTNDHRFINRSSHRNTRIERLDALELLGVAEVLRAEYRLDIPLTGINECRVDTEQIIDKHRYRLPSTAPTDATDTPLSSPAHLTV